jgi:hypothetical protein
LSLLTASLCLKYLNQFVTHKPITDVRAEIAIPIIPPEESDKLELFDSGVVDGTLVVVPEFPLLVWLGNGLLEVPDVATLIFPVAVVVAAPSQTPQPQKRISY